MDQISLLMPLLSGMLYRLPLLIALGAGFVLLLGAAPGRPRSRGVLGLSLLLASALLGALLTVVPLLLIQRGDEGLRMIGTVMGAAGVLVSCVEAAGVFLLVFALAGVLRAPARA